ncbi:hypothetical protein E2C01_061211 [Portunus trituberculatus]|uniref:Uncharacterized protein n=1 Tax=Portunus trituberculatus TaxID=210409 RepID=A0A5B7HB28_PORTR|nr:hypothetical protein [Portunus trituberculatus]
MHTSLSTFNSTCIQNDLLRKYTFCHKTNSKRVTSAEKLKFLKEELDKKQNPLESLTHWLAQLHSQWIEASLLDNLLSTINTAFEKLAEHHLTEGKRRTGRKISSLYSGSIDFPKKIPQFINLSKATLTEKQ